MTNKSDTTFPSSGISHLSNITFAQSNYYAKKLLSWVLVYIRQFQKKPETTSMKIIQIGKKLQKVKIMYLLLAKYVSKCAQCLKCCRSLML